MTSSVISNWLKINEAYKKWLLTTLDNMASINLPLIILYLPHLGKSCNEIHVSCKLHVNMTYMNGTLYVANEPLKYINVQYVMPLT